MNQRILIIVAILTLSMWTTSDLWARGGGGRGGGGGGRGGGGGMARSAAGRTPSMSRSSFSRPSGGYGGARPSGGARPGGGYSGARPSGGGNRASFGSLPTPNRPGSGISTRPGNITTRPGGSGSRPSFAGGAGAGRPGTSTRPAPGGRPSQGQLNDFLDLGGSGSRPSFNRPSTFPGAAGGAIAGNAAYDFLRDNPGRFERPSTLPATRPGPGDLAGGGRPGRPGGGLGPGGTERPSTLPGRVPGGEVGTRPGRPGGENRPGRPGERPNRPGNGDHRPDKRPDWNQWQNWRHDQWTNVNRDWHNNLNHYDRWFHGDWCQHHPYWHWRPGFNYWAWATWPAIVGWFPWGWSEPVYYNYGNNVYYADDTVYYGNTPVATADQYADQAAAIAANVPETPPPADSWMPLGVFAVMPDGDAAGAEPTLFLQLTVSKTGVIAGTLQNTASGKTTSIEGMVDKESQRAAWTEVGKTRPIMETGIGNLTQDTAAALVHFADGTTQQWLLVRMDAPPKDAAAGTTGAAGSSSATPATPPQ